ncbi:MAG: hypothetical protein ACLQGP_37040 [Isosphaeraceae bacterium]
MKSKVPFDPDFGKNARRWYWPIRSIGQLMIVVALSGLMFWGGSLRSRPPLRNTPRRILRPMTPVRVPAIPSPAPVVQPRDPFVVVASPEIDPAMVIRADPDLDAAMVVHPDARSWSPRVASPYDQPLAPRVSPQQKAR